MNARTKVHVYPILSCSAWSFRSSLYQTLISWPLFTRIGFTQLLKDNFFENASMPTGRMCDQTSFYVSKLMQEERVDLSGVPGRLKMGDMNFLAPIAYFVK